MRGRSPFKAFCTELGGCDLLVCVSELIRGCGSVVQGPGRGCSGLSGEDPSRVGGAQGHLDFVMD